MDKAKSRNNARSRTKNTARETAKQESRCKNNNSHC
jgi:hypothetical protein